MLWVTELLEFPRTFCEGISTALFLGLRTDIPFLFPISSTSDCCLSSFLFLFPSSQQTKSFSKMNYEVVVQSFSFRFPFLKTHLLFIRLSLSCSFPSLDSISEWISPLISDLNLFTMFLYSFFYLSSSFPAISQLILRVNLIVSLFSLCKQIRQSSFRSGVVENSIDVTCQTKNWNLRRGN